MNTASQASPSMLRAIWLILPAVLTGCGDFVDIIADAVEEKEPIQGIYGASLSPATVVLTAGNTSAEVGLSPSISGDPLPPNLFLHNPDWRVKVTRNFSAVVASTSSPATAISVAYIGPASPVAQDIGQWDGPNLVGGLLVAGALNIPAGMKPRNAHGRVSYQFAPTAANESEETPRLTILPAKLTFLPGATRVLTVTYKGPDATVTTWGVGQGGFNHNNFPPPLKDGVSFPASITYDSMAPPGTAVFAVGTSNGLTVSILLTGLGIPP